jgi:hypothetical protein
MVPTPSFAIAIVSFKNKTSKPILKHSKFDGFPSQIPTSLGSSKALQMAHTLIKMQY